METYGKILIIAMPLFLLLVLFEKWYGWRKGKDTVRNMDMVSSLTSGVGGGGVARMRFIHGLVNRRAVHL